MAQIHLRMSIIHRPEAKSEHSSSKRHTRSHSYSRSPSPKRHHDSSSRRKRSRSRSRSPRRHRRSRSHSRSPIGSLEEVLTDEGPVVLHLNDQGLQFTVGVLLHAVRVPAGAARPGSRDPAVVNDWP